MRKSLHLDRLQLIRSEERVVVIGSGFGGSVAALRLAQAGVPVLVLERGRRWPTGPNSKTFPEAFSPDKRALWYESAPRVFGRAAPFDSYAGLLDWVRGKNMTAICAAGVGGGSLIYQGMTLQPAEAVFNAHLPEELNYKVMDAVHYPRVAAMLKLQVAPDGLIETPTYTAPRVFARNVRREGFALSKIPMPIDWDYAWRELKGEMKPAYTNGGGSLGLNNGGKHSVDVTYIEEAERTGLVRVAPLHRVTNVSLMPDGRWSVEVDHTDLTGKVIEQKIITTKALIMAAGSLGTTKLLVRAAAHGAIPDMSNDLGKGWGTNADRIYVWNAKDDFGKQQGGPVVYGSKEWDDPMTANTIIQASLPSAPLGITRHRTMLVGFGVSDGRGQFTYDSKMDKAVLEWPKDGDAIAHKRIDERIRAVASPGTLLDTNAYLNTTWHALGGACMGTVCDLDGRVQGHRGLYVLDGALIPGNTAACNPSMTIAAVAERAMDKIVRLDVGTII